MYREQKQNKNNDDNWPISVPWYDNGQSVIADAFHMVGLPLAATSDVPVDRPSPMPHPQSAVN